MKRNKLAEKKESGTIDFIKLWKENQSKLQEEEDARIESGLLTMVEMIEERERKEYEEREIERKEQERKEREEQVQREIDMMWEEYKKFQTFDSEVVSKEMEQMWEKQKRYNFFHGSEHLELKSKNISHQKQENVRVNNINNDKLSEWEQYYDDIIDD